MESELKLTLQKGSSRSKASAMTLESEQEASTRTTTDKGGYVHESNLSDKEGYVHESNLSDKEGYVHESNLSDKEGSVHESNLSDKEGSVHESNISDNEGYVHESNLSDNEGSVHESNLSDNEGSVHESNLSDKEGSFHWSIISDKEGSFHESNISDNEGSVHESNQSDKEGSFHWSNISDNEGSVHESNISDNEGSVHESNLSDKEGSVHESNISDNEGSFHESNISDKEGSFHESNISDNEGSVHESNQSDKEGSFHESNISDKEGSIHESNISDKEGSVHESNQFDKEGSFHESNISDKEGSFHESNISDNEGSVHESNQFDEDGSFHEGNQSDKEGSVHESNQSDKEGSVHESTQSDKEGSVHEGNQSDKEGYVHESTQTDKEGSVHESNKEGSVHESNRSETSMPMAHRDKCIRVSAKYRGIAAYAELNMSHVSMRNVKSPDIIVKRDATHVVVGVAKGTQAVFHFEKKYLDIREYKRIQADMHESITLIPTESDRCISENDTIIADKMHCITDSHDELMHSPVTSKEAFDVFMDLPNVLGNKTQDCVPLEAILLPLKSICFREFLEISSEIGSNIKNILDTMQFVDDQFMELSQNKIHSKFPGFGKTTKIVHSSLEQYNQHLLCTLQSFSGQLHKGVDVTTDLSNLFSEHEHSPFSDSNMSKWVKGKQKELKLLETYATILGDATFITTRDELHQQTKNNDELACFHMNLNSCDDVQVSNTRKHLKISTEDKGCETDEVSSDDDWFAWFDNPIIKKSMHDKTKIFQNYREANPDVCCVIYTEEDNKKECGGSIILYRYGTPIISDFRPPSYCGKPTSTMNVTHDSVELQWSKPDYGREFITNYRIHYKHVTKDYTSTKCIDTPKTAEQFTVKELKPSTTYIFNVRGICEIGASPESGNSDEIGTMVKKDTLAESMTKTGKCLSKDPDIYRLPLNLVKKDPKKRVRHFTFGESDHTDHLPHKVLMIVGATGAGKSTLLNGMVNYMLNVQWTDPYRFKVVTPDDEETEHKDNQAFSQTTYITAYTFYKQTGTSFEYNLTVIDTPGYGDCQGISRDQEITRQIKDFFQHDNTVDHLDAVCFVAPAPGRLTPTQKYIIDSILAIYAKEIAENILLLITFADGEDPPVLESVNEAKIPYKDVYKFNNSALFAHVPRGGKSTDINEMFWQMGIHSLSILFSELDQLKPKSLQLTREVLREREKLETSIEALQPQIRASILEMRNLEKEKEIIEKHKRDIEDNKNFTYEVSEENIEKVDLPPGVHVTNCLTCNRTCHARCFIANDEDKRHCCAMGDDGYCEFCSCYWDIHKNMKYEFTTKTEIVKKEYAEQREKYYAALKDKSAKDIVLQGIVLRIENMQARAFVFMRKVKSNLARLSEIALRPNPLTTTNYIDILMQSEEQTAAAGFEERIKCLKKVREQAELIEKIDTDITDDDLLNKHKDKFELELEPNSDSRHLPKKTARPKKMSWWPFGK